MPLPKSLPAALPLLAVLLPLAAVAQTLSGRVTDQNTGEPLPFASIYVQQTGGGAVTNENGYYEVRLGGGQNTLVFQYLGYQTQVQRVSSGRGSLDVQLVPEALNLQEVEILSSGEDLSYSVIRRAIAKADFHRNQLDSYSADVYLKGGGRVKKIPKLYQKLAPKEDRAEMEKVIGRDFTSESVSKVRYRRPNQFSEEVISKYVRGNEDFDVSGFIFASFYQPEVANVVSPLSPRAFAYYRFAHEGVFVDQEELVNKIRVIPRSRGEDVFEGYVYIVQDDWSLHSLELTTYRTGFEAVVRQNYREIQEHVWMPVTTTIDVEGGFMGIKVAGKYVASVSNYVIELNPDLGDYVEVIDAKTNPEAAAAVRDLNRSLTTEQKLAGDGELTTRELRKLMKQYAREERAAQEDPDIDYSYSFTRDSVRRIRDSAYWNAVRPIPLTESEVRSYAVADSMAVVERRDSVEQADGTAPKTTKSGEQRRGLFSRIDLSPDGYFNPVSGYTPGLRLAVPIYRPERDSAHPRRRVLELRGRALYGFAWRRLGWEAGLRAGFDERRGGLLLTGGRNLRQFDRAGAIEPLINTYTALFYGDNYINLYERAFGELEYRRSFSDALRLRGWLAYEDRRAVRNHTDRRLFGNDPEFRYAANAPFNAELGRSVTELRPAATADVELTFRPGLKYYLRNGKKRLREEQFAPVLGLTVSVGLPEIGNSAADFTRVEGSYQHRFDVGRKGKADLLLRGGGFLNRDFVGFPDYKHFSTTETIITATDPIGSYRLLPYYTHSTAEEYLEAYAHYQFRKLIFGHIWQLHLMGIREDVFVNYLYTPTSEHHTELGYSVDNIFRFLRAEFVTSFRDGRYDAFGVRLSISSNFGRDDD